MVLTKLHGTPRQMGRTLGRLHQLAIWRVAAESRRSSHTATCDPEALKKALLDRSEQVREFFPDAWEHLSGMSETSGVPLGDLVKVSFGLPRMDPPPASSACTIIGFQQTPDGPVVGGNLDDPAWHFLTLEQPAEGYRCLFVSLPAYFTKWGGMNEHGLCMTGASGGPSLPGTADEKPRKTAPITRPGVWDVLARCRTTGEALSLLADPKFSFSNYMIGDTEGVVQVEGRADGTMDVFRETEDAPLCGGNLRRKDFEQPWYEKFFDRVPKDALGRYRLIRSLMAGYRGNPGVETAKTILTSHGRGKEDIDANASICRCATSVSLIGIPRRRKVLIGFAPPCVSGYREYPV